MKKFKLLLPALVALLAVTAAFTTKEKPTFSDKVWFFVDASGNAISSTNGTMGDNPPTECTDGTVLCARALSIIQNEVSLNSGSSTVYHINSGVNIQSAYDDEALKP